MKGFTYGWMNLRNRCAVRGCKPPHGAVIKSYGIERMRKRSRLKRDQVRITEMNASKPLMKYCDSNPLSKVLFRAIG